MCDFMLNGGDQIVSQRFNLLPSSPVHSAIPITRSSLGVSLNNRPLGLQHYHG